MSFSVLLSVYIKENPLYLRCSLESILKQSKMPSEVVIVKDGPLTDDLDSVISQIQETYPIIKVISLTENVGLGLALNEGLKECSFDLVARMDTDDISQYDRFEKQIAYFEQYPELSLVGGAISEFIDTPNLPISKRVCPTSPEKIKNEMKYRCPFNHMSVMFKKSEVIKAGGYLHCLYNEDYYLWIRMMQNNANFANTKDVLVDVRVGKDMYERRGGVTYFKGELFIQKYLLKTKIINIFEFSINVSIRFIVQILVPTRLRSVVFKVFFRKK